ncbi:ATP-binding protein [Spiractinospora alimapuensis]|uniref:ATP-binding protein n=1 Tax=Spiractinospora alimapuensis TaxID=2820884 RepID=UPI001F233E18|nr:ATP-binding protein [Spiractinospora alimapuensis]QVQ53833.1 ATP-binding protein [Spiractinospora alimapuensis]
MSPDEQQRRFPGVAFGVRLARRWLTDQLDEGGVEPELCSNAVQVLAELAANAAEHTRSGLPGGTFHVRLRVGNTKLRLEVTDQGSDETAPVARRAGPFATSGHGLEIVNALSSQWWTKSHDDGRTVFAEVPHTPDTPPPGFSASVHAGAV